MDLFKLMKNMDNIKKMFAEQQKAQTNTTYEGESGAGWVKITMDGDGNAKKIELSDDVLKEDKEVLSELIVAAINDCNNKLNQGRQDSMGELSQLLGGSLPAGFGFGGSTPSPTTPADEPNTKDDN